MWCVLCGLTHVLVGSAAAMGTATVTCVGGYLQQPRAWQPSHVLVDIYSRPWVQHLSHETCSSLSPLICWVERSILYLSSLKEQITHQFTGERSTVWSHIVNIHVLLVRVGALAPFLRAKGSKRLLILHVVFAMILLLILSVYLFIYFVCLLIYILHASSHAYEGGSRGPQVRKKARP